MFHRLLAAGLVRTPGVEGGDVPEAEVDIDEAVVDARAEPPIHPISLYPRRTRSNTSLYFGPAGHWGYPPKSNRGSIEEPMLEMNSSEPKSLSCTTGKRAEATLSPPACAVNAALCICHRCVNDRQFPRGITARRRAPTRKVREGERTLRIEDGLRNPTEEHTFTLRIEDGLWGPTQKHTTTLRIEDGPATKCDR
eukprot:gene12021-biopygen11134